MILHPPFEITARLLPGVKIQERTADKPAYLSIEYAGVTEDGRRRYRYHIDLPDGTEYSAADLKSGVGGGNLQAGMASLLSFLSHAAECHPDPDGDLFPKAVCEWAKNQSDELLMLHLEIEESKTPLIEE